MIEIGLDNCWSDSSAYSGGVEGHLGSQAEEAGIWVDRNLTRELVND
jgi:hypothetical protein